MKTPLFIVNAVSLILIINFLITGSSITGFMIVPTETSLSEKPNLDLASPLGLAVIFIFTVTALDIYFYRKSRHGVLSY